MPKVELTCEQCDSPFSVFPSAIHHAKKRGGNIRFCSRACTGAARSAGTLPGRPRNGKHISCIICGTVVYRSPKRIKDDRAYTCSEECRLSALKAKLINLSKPRPNRLKGEYIDCRICGKTVYRKKSMIERRIRMTCGNKKCVSAYSRSLWGLPPLTPVQARYKKGPARRNTNFTAAQRVAWTGDKCAICGSKDNLCLDHIIPVSAGGKSIKENSQTLCQPCNIWKSNHIDKKLANAYNKSCG